MVPAATILPATVVLAVVVRPVVVTRRRAMLVTGMWPGRYDIDLRLNRVIPKGLRLRCGTDATERQQGGCGDGEGKLFHGNSGEVMGATIVIGRCEGFVSRTRSVMNNCKPSAAVQPGCLRAAVDAGVGNIRRSASKNRSDCSRSVCTCEATFSASVASTVASGRQVDCAMIRCRQARSRSYKSSYACAMVAPATNAGAPHER